MKLKSSSELGKSIYLNPKENQKRFSEKAIEGIRSELAKNLNGVSLPSVEEIKKSLDDGKDKMEKAFEAGHGITPQTQPDGAALRMEALDPSVYVTTWTEQDFTIYKDVQAVATDQTVQKYVVYYSHGRSGHSLFQPEIGIGSVNTPSLDQKTVQMKFIVNTEQQSFAMQMAATTQDTTKILEMSAIANVVKSIEWATFYGDASLTSTSDPQGGLEFDGLTKLIDENNIIDARGKELTPELLNAAAVKIGLGFGTATNAYMPIGVKAAFINKFLPAQRILQPNPQGNGMQLGFDIARFISARGDIALEGSTIMDLDNILDENAPSSNQILAPQVQAAEDSATAGSFLAADVKDENGNVVVPSEVNKTLSYKVVAVGHNGNSMPSDAVTAKVTDASHSVKLTINLVTLGGQAPDYVAIYRQSLVPGDNRYFLISRVAANKQDGKGTITFNDTDAIIAGTADVFVGDVNPQVISYYEFAPITKFDLAQVTTATSFAILWYGALALRYPKRFVRIKNVRYASLEG